MLTVLATIWLLLQLPAAVVLGRFLRCPQRQRVKRIEARQLLLPTRSNAA